MPRHVGLVVIALMIGGAGSVRAGTAPQDGAPIAIGNYRTIHSKILDEDRTLLVHLPESYSRTSASYPVAYLLYGDHVSTYFAEAVAAIDTLGSGGRIPECILIGIMNTDRYRDLLPEVRGEPTGIDNFIRFLDAELFPWVEKELRTKRFRILVGPQAGASFALYTLMNRPRMFNALVIESPFRWRGGRELLLDTATSFFSERTQMRRFMHVSFREKDELEKESLPYLTEFAEIVGKAADPNFRLVLDQVPIDGEFLVPFRIGEGLRELFADFPFPEDLQVASLDSILGHYGALSVRFGFAVDPPQLVLATHSNRLTERGDTRGAVDILEFMLEKDPTSLDALWQLGNHCETAGRLAQAVEYYERMVALMGSDAGMIAQRVEQLKTRIEAEADGAPPKAPGIHRP